MKTNVLLCKLSGYGCKAAEVGIMLLQPEPTPAKTARRRLSVVKNTSIDQSIAGIIISFGDVLSLQGKKAMVRKLMPSLHASFKEPGSVIHRLLDANPDAIDQWGRYKNHPSGKRRKAIRQHINRPEWQELLPFAIQGFTFLADLYQSEGVTLAEAERLLTQGFKDALTSITLSELVGTHDNVSENEIRDALCRLKLSTGSVAGKDQRLRYELDQRYGPVRYEFGQRIPPDYEQDLKTALWDCSKGNNHMMTEMMKALEGVSPDDQVALFIRMLSGKEPGLMRATLLSFIGKTIADLPGIAEATRDRRKRKDANVTTLPLDDDSLNIIEDEDSKRSRDLMELRANLNQLTPRELDIFQRELERREAGKTRDEWYEHKEAERVKQQLKYMRSKHT